MKNAVFISAILLLFGWWILGFPSVEEAELIWDHPSPKMAVIFWYWFLATALLASKAEKKLPDVPLVGQTVFGYSAAFTLSLLTVIWLVSPIKPI